MYLDKYEDDFEWIVGYIWNLKNGQSLTFWKLHFIW